MKNIKKSVALMLAVLMIGGIVAGCGSNDNENKSGEKTTEAGEPVTINVFIAASLKNVMEEIQKEYEADNSNVTIVYNADSSGTLQTQIEEGAECDIFFSAASKQMDALNDSGIITEGSIVDLLENKVVLIKGKGLETKVKSFEDITTAANLALAGEDVPVGAYSREIFTNMGIFDDVMKMEINQGANVTAVLTAVGEGSNEIGTVYATDAASMPDKVEIIAEAPEGTWEKPVIYPIGMVKNTEADANQTKAAENFMKYLQTDSVMKLFEKYGFASAK